MAITIHQQPDLHSAISTPLIVTATSTNSNNDGFKFVVQVDTGLNLSLNDMYISANNNGYLVYDVAPMMRPYMRNLNYIESTLGLNGGSIHNLYNPNFLNINEQYAGTQIPHAGCTIIDVSIKEGWNVDGVFTINNPSEVNFNIVVYNFQDFGIRNGYKPDLLATIGHNEGDQSRLMSDRLPTTYDWPAARFVGISQPNAIYIPVREADYGQWGVRTAISEGTGSTASKVRLSILPNSGPPVQEVYSLDPITLWAHLPLYPANLNESTLPDILKPSDYPNWKAIYFQILNESDEQVSMNYVMFNVDHPQYGECSCHGYEIVRLAWVGRRGGWEYQNFTLLSETEYETEQKTAKRVVGNYGNVQSSTDFYFNPIDESEFVTYKKINKFVTCNTDILQPGEWEFLKGLILSKQVHWVHDDGTHTPVIIQDSNFKVRNPKSKAREALTVRFKVAQDQSN